MKGLKILAIVLVIALLAVGFMACNDEVVAEGEYTIVSPDGAPALAIASFIDRADANASLVIKPSISATIAQDALKNDFAILPANAAVKLYNAGNEIKMVATITNGNMFIVSKENDESFELNHLVGKVLYTIGQGSIPSIMLLATLQANNIAYEESETPVEGKVAIQYCLDGQALIGKVKTATTQVYGNLAEPAVSTMVSKGLGYKVASLQELWKTASGSEVAGYPQAVLIAKKSICDEKPEVVDAVLNIIKNNETVIVEEYASAIDKVKTIYEGTSLDAKTMTAQSVANCNIKVYRASTNIDYIYAGLTAARQVAPNLFGGEIPAKGSEFYY